MLRCATVCAVLCVCAFGCATSRSAVDAREGAPENSRAASVSAAADVMSALATALPSGADQCVLSRPPQLTAEERALFVRLSRADALSWLPGLAVRAAATAQRRTSDGGVLQVTMLHLDMPEAGARAVIERKSGLQLDWPASEEPLRCGPDDCPLRARFVAPSLLRIERGVWPQGMGQGAEAHCRQLAARVVDALELVATRTRRLGLGDVGARLSGRALRARTRVLRTTTGVRVSQVELMQSEAAARRAAAEAELTQLATPPVGALRTRTAHRQVGALFYTDYETRFEDLELAVQDEARSASAARYAAALQRLQPHDEIDLREHAQVTAQVDYRIELLKHSGAARFELAQELSELLQRARVLYPEDARLASLQCELWIRDLDRADEGLALAEAFLHRHDAFRSLRREAAASVSGEVLSRALLADGLVAEPARASTAAREIRRRILAGEAYAAAERSVLKAGR